MVTTNSGLLVGGEWRHPGGRARSEVRNPATGDVLGAVAVASSDDVDDAVRAARAAAPSLAAMNEFERAEALHRVADLLDRDAGALARQLTDESGKPHRAEAVDELAESAEIFRLAAEEVKRLGGEVMPSIESSKRVFTHRRPVGVVVLITPFNFPMNIPAELLAASLAGGNPTILKPSERTPWSAAALGQVVTDAGFPAGSVGVLHGGREVGAALVGHRGVDAIGFVGSHGAAEAIVRTAGLKRTLLEASGNGPQIVLDDADVEGAARAAVYGAYFVAGQCCVATERLLVQRRLHDELLEALVDAARDAVLGDPTDDATTLGPLNNELVGAQVARHVDDAVARGGRLLRGGRPDDTFPTPLYWPLTIIDGVERDFLAFREETFGPVLPITTFDDDDEAVSMANDSELGLQAAVFTRDLGRAFRFVDDLRTGTVLVNESTCFWEQHPPFGGAAGTRTGWGRIGGKFTLHDLTDLRAAVIDVG